MSSGMSYRFSSYRLVALLQSQTTLFVPDHPHSGKELLFDISHFNLSPTISFGLLVNHLRYIYDDNK
jgi:hypothetical protein